MIENKTFLPINLFLANPNPTNDEEIIAPVVAIVLTIIEFLKKVANVTPPNPFHPSG